MCIIRPIAVQQNTTPFKDKDDSTTHLSFMNYKGTGSFISTILITGPYSCKDGSQLKRFGF